jgi:hypothetical protein
MASHRKQPPRAVLAAAIVIAVAIVLAVIVGNRLTRERPQSARITSDPLTNFLYGSIGSEKNGLPFWVAVVLPRVFGGEDLPGPGGYAAVGVAWQEGTELPVGFSKKAVGVDRVGYNCALCHTAQYRATKHQTPIIVPAGGSATLDVQALIDFFTMAANDARFNADTLLTEIDLAYRLNWLDRVLYRYVLIPEAKTRLKTIGRQFGGPHARMSAHAKIPPLWRLATSVRPIMLAVDGTDPAVQTRRADDLDRWVKQLPPPKFPAALSSEEMASHTAGEAIFKQQCARCHGERRLDGLWLRGPYLHNGSVPTVRELLEPAMCRPNTFLRGYDLLDTENLGFAARRCGEIEPRRAAGCDTVAASACVPAGQGRPFDASVPGNENTSHEFGTTLSAADKRKLVAFLKTF